MRDNTTKSSNGMDWEINKRARFVRMDSIRPQAQVWRYAPAVNPKGDVLSQEERVCPHNVDAAIASYRFNAVQPRAFCYGGFFRRTDRLDDSGSRHQNGRFLPDADKTRRGPAKNTKAEILHCLTKQSRLPGAEYGASCI